MRLLLRSVPPLLALAALLASGCMLTSAQVLATYDLPNPFPVVSPTQIAGVRVDLNTVDGYQKHKDKLEDIADLAVLGRFKNVGPAVSVSLYMVADDTKPLYTSAAALLADPAAVRVWGPIALPAGPSTTSITWDESAALFGAGRGPLVGEIKGDGRFTLYAVGSAGAYAFELDNGALAVVLDGGL